MLLGINSKAKFHLGHLYVIDPRKHLRRLTYRAQWDIKLPLILPFDTDSGRFFISGAQSAQEHVQLQVQ